MVFLKISNAKFYLSVYKKATEFCILTLYPVNLPYSLYSSPHLEEIGMLELSRF